MRFSRPSAAAAVACLALTACARHAAAQPAAARPKESPARAAAVERDPDAAEAERARAARREQARALLFALSGEARGFRDPVLRARSLARTADALWIVAEEQARALFREAWDAAGGAEREDDERRDLRGGVLAPAARRDRPLAEEFLQKLRAEQEEAASGGKGSPAHDSQWALPGASEKRLELATNLLGTGDVERALQFADPVLGGVTLSTVEFLTLLRGRDAAAADRRYAAMLSGAATNPLADANTVSLLSSYLFTPHLYVMFNREGGADTSSWGTAFPPPLVEPGLRLAFFRTAAAVLLRPQPPPEQDRSSAGLVGRYLVLKRLSPLFERHAPQEVAQAVRGQFESLDSQVGDGARRGDDEWVKKGIAPESQPAERRRSLLDELEQARTSADRDELYFRLALDALGDDGAKAREYAGKIDDMHFRLRARAWVDWSLALRAVEKGKAEAALELASEGELTRTQRVWLLARAARLLAKTDRDKAQSLVDDARSEARLIDRLDPDRPRGLLAVANAQRLVEPSRLWDALADAVEAANSAEGFTGEDARIASNVNSKGRVMMKTDSAPDFDVAGVFGEAAVADLGRAAQLARSFKGEAPRTNALVAVARAVLAETAAPRPRTARRD
ncbi:MAG TPA: hypothetical protein VF736_10320 [Pyrinomonadaceae bacterium]|jgi:hypothetical protein